MQYAFVLSARRTPLMPCHPARARKLLNQHRAAVYRLYPFTIILKDRVEGECQPVSLQIDPGSKTTGLALVVEGKRGRRAVFGLNLIHRGPAISEALKSRAAIRRGRRSRNTRYRAPRFLNRGRRKGWLPPSVQHRVDTTKTWIDRLCRWVPVVSARVEAVKFDIQRLQNPLIGGVQYQQGPLFKTEMREYLLKVHNHTCQYCHGTSRDSILQIEHILPRSRGGTDSLANLTLACRQCNIKKLDLTPEEWHVKLALSQRTAKDPYLSRVLADLPKFYENHQEPKSLKDVAVMNATRYRLRDYFGDLGIPCGEFAGWETKRRRLDAKLPKDHWIDAACIGPTGVANLALGETGLTEAELAADAVTLVPGLKPWTAKCMGHGHRLMEQHDRCGFPKVNKAGKRSTVRGPSLTFGFRTGDLVRATVPSGKFKGVHNGRVAIRSTGYFDITTQTAKVTVNYKYCQRLQADDSYRYWSGSWQIKTVVASSREAFFALIKREHWRQYRIVSQKALADGYTVTVERPL